MSEENFNWWKRLQSKDPTFSGFKEAVSKMFKMFPKNAELEPANSNRCRTCAVVGNSASIVGSHYGPLIDFQDYVIRYVERDSGTSMNVFFLQIRN
ncbi:CMP-N-acetylneuraminate-beta-galactosamide-alpha-2,3-sialyltransferase 1 [Liparis tanakae]|uniref:CMP-N-acetylneuraminate-beta-galactosamide-alpha-2,3-sialyltransferase 1 n=1 Tax=Liparis tanakae TaxID=230148 RepID=A0A4Z2EBD5_9TELE|nr:CMP-N-acetylneuraminate-beta-galactosamide-alpha-2,3-sialyltransferase 1 [Liparis tanakae]